MKEEEKEPEQELMTAVEAEEILDSILDYYSLSEEDKNAADWLAELVVKTTTKDELFLSLIKTITHWNLYLLLFEGQEEYEICAKIIRVIDYEVLEFIIMMSTNFGITDEDIVYFQQINDEIRRQIIIKAEKDADND